MKWPTALTTLSSALKMDDPPVRAIAFLTNQCVQRLLSLNCYFHNEAESAEEIIRHRAVRLIIDRVKDDFDPGLRALRQAGATLDPDILQAELRCFVGDSVSQAFTEYRRTLFLANADTHSERSSPMADSNHERLPQPPLTTSPDTASMLICPPISGIIGQACHQVAHQWGVDPSPELVAEVRDGLRYRRETRDLCLRLEQALSALRQLVAHECERAIAGALQSEVACESILPYESWNATSLAPPPAGLPTSPEISPSIASLGTFSSWESGVTH